MTGPDVQVLLAGGGLAGCLVALRLAETGRRVTLVEAADEICGNHTWSFHLTDLDPQDRQRLDSLIAHCWPGQQVIFPRYRRRLTTPYASITSGTLRRAIRAEPAITVRENAPITSLAADHVEMEGGERIAAPCVIDSRGFAPSSGLKLGFQKFVGIELELDRPHGEEVPTIMDASVDQRDGYRFFYILPLSPTRLLIEDTRYSDRGDLDFEALQSDVLAYAANRAWVVRRSIRTEKGILPITLAHDVECFWNGVAIDTAPIGLRAGLFHPTTGYSLPTAIDIANLIAGLDNPLTTGAVREAVHHLALRRCRELGFYRFLNRMLFRAAKPRERYRVLQRFYRLPQTLIERFYAGSIRSSDKLRLLIGKPPVQIHKALRCVSERQALSGDQTD